MSRWTGQPSIMGSSDAVRMILLNFCTLGITFTWGVEMTYCTPYLLSLGLTKSKTSLVWIAGPLSGLVVQPIVGAIADESKSKWGRRRPFIVVGAVVVALCLLALGFTKEIVGIFISDEEAAKTPTIVVAILCIYAVDFSINAVMSAARSLMVDVLPISKQQDGAAWNSRMSAIGHLIGYAAGAIDLGAIFGDFLGDTQFKKLTVVAAFGILTSSLITSLTVTERILVEIRKDPHQSGGQLKVLRQIWSTILHLPPRIRAICHAQFWAWIGWFPFLFYSTTWVGETYFRYDVPDDARTSEDTLGEMGRIGSSSLVLYSAITFTGAWLLPLLIKSPDDEGFTQRPPQSVAHILEKFQKHKPDLLTAWMIGHGMFAAAMFLAPFATSFRFATVLVCICGLPWTMAMWAPVAFMGVEVNRLSGGGENTASYRPLDSVELSEMNGHSDALRLEHGSNDAESGTKGGSTGELSGIYFGILNIYTTIPQFIGTFISTIVFAIFAPGTHPELHGGSGGDDAAAKGPAKEDGPNAISICLFIGAISATVAIFATNKLRYL
ncbi:major facilitator superfamily domain-containing protein [Truncatella angustata]|uniref:Major facilitator superfamily domain-containing protein n=1 Tax=Truncatella angustata TaxID=152316 RepID=A0A9P8UXJ9_9PEZI|nr:major facilitator superfamily domain-containing protein [Truncatella angustata]KAH6660023.1 major facilitator superfamily domain-containing protein [Truncatella angustata]